MALGTVVKGTGSEFFISKVTGSIYEELQEKKDTFNTTKDVEKYFDFLTSDLNTKHFMKFQQELHELYPDKTIQIVISNLSTQEISQYIEECCSDLYHYLVKKIIGSNSVFFISKLVGHFQNELQKNVSNYHKKEDIYNYFNTLTKDLSYDDIMKFKDELLVHYPEKKIRLYMEQNFSYAKA